MYLMFGKLPLVSFSCFLYYICQMLSSKLSSVNVIWGHITHNNRLETVLRFAGTISQTDSKNWYIGLKEFTKAQANLFTSGAQPVLQFSLQG